MDIKYKNLARRLSDLDKEAQIIDSKIGEIRIEINDLFWTIINFKKRKNESSIEEKNLH